MTHVSHSAKYSPYFEPYFVSPDTCPVHDERFVGFGFDRNSQVALMVTYRHNILFDCDMTIPQMTIRRMLIKRHFFALSLIEGLC